MAKDKYIKTIIAGLAVTIGGWAVFTLTKLSLTTLLIKIGINDEILQMAIIVVLILLILFGLGVGFKKSLKKII